MDLIPLKPELVRGTHGAIPKDRLDWPVIFGHSIHPTDQPIQAPEVHGHILQALALPK